MSGYVRASRTSLVKQPYGVWKDSDRVHPVGVEEAKAEREQEQMLLRNLAQGDSAAFWGLWERYQKSLFGLCLQQMRGNRADAEDALSQAMMKAWDRLPGCAGKITNLGAWLARLTHNLCLDMHRERERRTRDVQSLEEITVANEAALAQTMQSPEETVLRHELYGHILHAIDNLPSRLREPFILRFLQEMPYPDIAKQLALSPENVRKRIQQARAILRGRLNPYLSRVDGFGRENPGSHQPATFNREAPMIGQRPFNREEPEVKSKIVATRVVQVILPSGMERSFHIFLNHKPTKPHFRIKTLGMYVQHHPQGWKKRLELANFLYAVGCWEEAIQDYRQVLERQPRLFNVWLQLGNILHLMEREEGAIAAYGSALPLTRKVATQHHVSGLIEACRRHHEAATREFEEAASLEPHNVAHWRLLGLAHLRAENSHEALGAFDEALKIDPDDLVALTRSCEALRAVGREEEAQQRVGRVLLIVPNDVLALKRMADHRSQSGLVRGPAGTETRRLIRRAQRLAPEMADVRESLALFYFCRSERDAGLAILQSYTEQHPTCPRGWYHYARWLASTGDTPAAVEAIMKASAFRGDDQDIHRAAREILSLASQPEERRLVARVGGSLATVFAEGIET